MSNLKKPFFWAYIVIELYFISFGLAGMVAMPFLLVKAVYGVGGFLLCYHVAISVRRPVSDNSYVGISFMLVGLIFIVAGKNLLNELWYPLHPVNYFEYTRWYEVLPSLMIVMISCGVLTVLFSILGLILNTKSRKSMRDSVSRMNS